MNISWWMPSTAAELQDALMIGIPELTTSPMFKHSLGAVVA
jgi:hypothetical protein